MGRPVVHFEIMGADGKRLVEFYRKAFGWDMDWQDQFAYGVVTTKAGRGIDGGVGGSQGTKPVCRVYVEVPDPAAALEEIERLGGRTLMRPEEVPGASVTIALFADPEGNEIGLLKGSG